MDKHGFSDAMIRAHRITHVDGAELTGNDLGRVMRELQAWELESRGAHITLEGSSVTTEHATVERIEL